MQIGVLGPLEVVVDGVAVAVPGPRRRGLLTALALATGFTVPAHRLAEHLWGEDVPDTYEGLLHTTVARLRGSLGAAAGTVVTRPGGYALDLDPMQVDAFRFERLYGQARALAGRKPAEALRTLDNALGLWRGPAYAEYADTFARPAATRLEELRLAAREDRVALLLAQGDATAAVAEAGRLAAHEQLRDRPIELSMRALSAAGRTTEALETFRAHRDRVADETGLDPSLALRELEAAILRGEDQRPAPTGAAPPPRRQPRRRSAPRHRRHRGPVARCRGGGRG